MSDEHGGCITFTPLERMAPPSQGGDYQAASSAWKPAVPVRQVPSLWINTALQWALLQVLVPGGHIHPHTEKKDISTQGHNLYLVSYLAIHQTTEATSNGTKDTGESSFPKPYMDSCPTDPSTASHSRRQAAGDLREASQKQAKEKAAVYTYQSCQQKSVIFSITQKVLTPRFSGVPRPFQYKASGTLSTWMHTWREKQHQFCRNTSSRKSLYYSFCIGCGYVYHSKSNTIHEPNFNLLLTKEKYKENSTARFSHNHLNCNSGKQVFLQSKHGYTPKITSLVS